MPPNQKKINPKIQDTSRSSNTLNSLKIHALGLSELQRQQYQNIETETSVDEIEQKTDN